MGVTPEEVEGRTGEGEVIRRIGQMVWGLRSELWRCGELELGNASVVFGAWSGRDFDLEAACNGGWSGGGCVHEVTPEAERDFVVEVGWRTSEVLLEVGL